MIGKSAKFRVKNHGPAHVNLAMKTVLFLIIFALALSCKTNRYAGEAIKGSPILTSLTNANSNGILIAKTNTGTIDPIFEENCLKGLKLYFELHTNLEIADDLVLNVYPDATILNELKDKYQVNGILVLNKLKIQKKAYDIQIEKPHFFPESHGAYAHPAYWGTIAIPWTNLYAQITSKWRYFDLNSRRQYDFEVKNKKVFEFEEYVSNTDSLLIHNPAILDPLFYQNGRMMAEKLMNKPTGTTGLGEK